MCSPGAVHEKSRGIIRRSQGEDRDKQLAAIKAEYADRLQKVPPKARTLAEAYIAEVKKGWDKTDDDTVFKVLDTRNAAFKACGITPEEAGSSGRFVSTFRVVQTTAAYSARPVVTVVPV